jgi:exopolyphosphatase/guanosine-5'-triphosphate,3'-diphosphate pyrophosphatase
LAAYRKWVKDFLAKAVRPDLDPALKRETRANSGPRPVQLIGTGGTAAVLARMEARLETHDRGRIEATLLGIAQTRAQVERLWGLPLAERKKITGLPRDRADVILPGVVIYEGVMEEFGFQELRVSTRGLRFAAVMDAR